MSLRDVPASMSPGMGLPMPCHAWLFTSELGSDTELLGAQDPKLSAGSGVGSTELAADEMV